MKTAAFFQHIDRHPAKPLRFRDHRNTLIHPSYHVSEVKAASFQTVDCGGMAHEWNETILQLWLSGDPDAERPMLAGKAAEILTKVSQQIDIDPDSELRIEHGSEDYPSVAFHIESIEEEEGEGEGALIVSLRAPVAACKLEERGGTCARPVAEEKKASSCCSGTAKSTGCC